MIRAPFRSRLGGTINTQAPLFEMSVSVRKFSSVVRVIELSDLCVVKSLRQPAEDLEGLSYFRFMHPLLKIFFTGMLVSFLGSLPLGTLNVAAMQISVSEGITAAILFSLGSLTAEIVYVRLSLVAMDWVRKQEKIFRILEWVTLAVVLALGGYQFLCGPTSNGWKECYPQQ